ncbi:MAG: HEAT repeat domain-containing protein, partial [Planctomycetota bacterium]
MSTPSDQPDPLPYIDRLEAEDAFDREAAAWSLGEIGSPRAARPLAGLLLRELKGVERSGYLDHGSVVRAVSVAIRRIGAVEALYALIKALCVLTRARGVDEETIEEIVESLAEV